MPEEEFWRQMSVYRDLGPSYLIQVPFEKLGAPSFVKFDLIFFGKVRLSGNTGKVGTNQSKVSPFLKWEKRENRRQYVFSDIIHSRQFLLLLV
jgi:hypothetical protein